MTGGTTGIAAATVDRPPVPVPAPRFGRERGAAGWLALAAVLWLLRLPTWQLWGDVRFTLGVERATAATGWPSWQVWAHRPLLDRVLMAGLDHLTAGFAREQQLLAWGCLLAGLSTYALCRGLRPRLGAGPAAGLAGAVLVALVWAPPRTVLQPEWFAMLAGVAAIAAALWPTTSRRGAWLVPAVSALLLTSATLLKWTTVNTTVIAWVVIVALLWRRDRGRVIRLTVLTAVLHPLVLGLQFLLVPQELSWFLQLPGLNPAPEAMTWCDPLRVSTAAGCSWANLLDNELITSPALVVLPAAVVLLVRSTRGGARVAAVVVPAVTLVATLATTILQAQWFSYHAAALPVVAAAWLGWTLGTLRGRARTGLAVATVAVGVPAAVLLSLPEAVRTSTHPVWTGIPPAAVVFLVLKAYALVLAGLAARVRLGAPGVDDGTRRTGWSAALGIAAVVTATMNSVLPTTAFTLNFQAVDKTAAAEARKHREQQATADRVRAAIGSRTSVVYLAFGERSYWVQNPTHCRYAAATFLQRSRYVPTRGLPAFAENLACLDDPRDRYVVLEPKWLNLPKADPEIRARLTEAFDCDRPVVDSPDVVVCPRRVG